jgi:hypothetical protein
LRQRFALALVGDLQLGLAVGYRLNAQLSRAFRLPADRNRRHGAPAVFVLRNGADVRRPARQIDPVGSGRG